MLVELRLVEQRYQAVLEVINDGAAVTDVARRFGVARQTVHVWLREYASHGLAGLADRSSKPLSCPHQMVPTVEARIVSMRREHPGWGPRTILYWLAKEGVVPLPGRTSVERCLVRHGLVTPKPRRRKRSDYVRWERLPVDGAVADGHRGRCAPRRRQRSEDRVGHRRPLPVRDLRRGGGAGHGPAGVRRPGGGHQPSRGAGGDPDRQRQGVHRPVRARPGAVRFDRICRDHGIDHILTAPRSPTTTGKVERWHKTLRAEFLSGKVFASLDDAQAQLDAWVHEYNHERPHQSIGRVPPIERFRLAEPRQPASKPPKLVEGDASAEPVTTRRVSNKGTVSFATASYKAGAWLAGQTVEVVCEGGLVHLEHRGVRIATHARRHPPAKQAAGLERGRTLAPSRPAARSATVASVTRKVDTSGNVCFAGTNYRVGSSYRRRQVQVAVVGDTVEISIGNELIRSHPVRHDRTREHGALANPGGRPRRSNAA